MDVLQTTYRWQSRWRRMVLGGRAQFRAEDWRQCSLHAFPSRFWTILPNSTLIPNSEYHNSKTSIDVTWLMACHSGRLWHLANQLLFNQLLLKFNFTRWIEGLIYTLLPMHLSIATGIFLKKDYYSNGSYKWKQKGEEKKKVVLAAKSFSVRKMVN